MTAVNVVGSKLVVRAQTVIVYIVLGILIVFAVVTLANMHPSLLAPSGYPPLRHIISQRGADLLRLPRLRHHHVHREGPRRAVAPAARAMYHLALGIATVIYVAIALGVFGTLTVDKVISSGGTALAAWPPSPRSAGGLLADERHRAVRHGSATNAGLYPAPGLCERLAETGQFPPLMARQGEAGARRRAC